jgi:hypothetical protein
MIEAAARYNRLVQVGTMNRSRPPVREAIKFIHEGGLGKVYMARGLCFKPRPAIGKYPDGPDGTGEKVRADDDVDRRTSRPTTSSTCRKVDYDLWLGPPPKRPFNRNHFHYNWHWHWNYGNGDSGNQGPAPVRHRALGAAEAGAPGQDPRGRRLLRRRGVAGNAERADRPLRVRRRHDHGVRDARRLHQRRRQRQDRQPVLRHEGAGCGSRRPARNGSRTSGPKNEKGPGTDTSDPNSEPTGLTTTEYPHYQNFIDAIRANDSKVLACDAYEGHLSSALPHLGNISYRVGRALTFDGKAEKFVDDKQADRLLTREYRERLRDSRRRSAAVRTTRRTGRRM